MRREAPRANDLLSDAFDLELSAFSMDPPLTEIRDPRMIYADLARPQGIRRPGRPSSMQNNKDAVKRTKYSQPDPRRVAQALAEKKRDAAPKLTANREHLQADQPSRDSRKENVRGRCNERPENNKGRGTGRKFVPWCDRKR